MESLSPAPATTAEEVMASSGDHGERGASQRENAALSEDTQCPAGATTRQEEATPEVEQWAAAVPPVRNEFSKDYIKYRANTRLLPIADQHK